MRSHFFIDFGQIFTPDFDPRTLQKYGFSLGKHRFFIKSLFADDIDFSAFLVPSLLHFGRKKPPKTVEKSILEGIDFSIDFGIDFFSIFDRLGLHLGPKLGPCWSLFRFKTAP